MSELSEVYSVTKNGVRYLATKEFKGVGRPTTTVYVLDEARSPTKREIATVRAMLTQTRPTWKRGTRR